MLRTAIDQCAAWAAEGLDLHVAVNLTIPDLLDLELPDRIAAMLADAGVPADRLELEVTESTILADPFRVRHVIDRLNELGVGFAIDDFGTGYSSLAYLKQLPVQTIKIDRSFVMDMLESESDAAIVRSTIDLARNLGLRVVAEGVETEAMWDALREQGCTLAQGYLISKPVSAAELAPLLVRRRGGVERLPVRRLAELGRPLVRPRGREARRVGLDPDARQVEPVGVPADADGRVGGDEPVRVLEAGVAERLELRRRRPEQPLGVQLDRERRRARPVPGVDRVVLAHRVVQEREEEDHERVGPVERLREPEPVRADGAPVHVALNPGAEDWRLPPPRGVDFERGIGGQRG